MQQTQIIGRLGQDSEVRDVGSTQVINFSVAVSEKWKDKDGNFQENTKWYECARWGNNVQVSNFLKKGTQVYIEGVSEARAYINKEGEAVAVNGIKVFKIELLGGKNDNQQQSQPHDAKPMHGTGVKDDDDNLPF